VFQSYALYPHLSVAENMSFGLKLAGTKKAEISLRPGLLHRRPGQRTVFRAPRSYLNPARLAGLFFARSIVNPLHCAAPDA